MKATAYSLRGDSVVSTSLVEVDDEGYVIWAAGYWTHNIRTRAYDAEFRASRLLADSVAIVHDEGAGYLNALAGLNLPPAYRSARVAS